jgi:hypothetical protein
VQISQFFEIVRKPQLRGRLLLQTENILDPRPTIMPIPGFSAEIENSAKSPIYMFLRKLPAKALRTSRQIPLDEARVWFAGASAISPIRTAVDTRMRHDRKR